jgi:hypothetical protein
MKRKQFLIMVSEVLEDIKEMNHVFEENPDEGDIDWWAFIGIDEIDETQNDEKTL